MSKYEPLRQHLASRPEYILTARFSEIERILGFQLPASAYRYPAWWSNSQGSHVQAYSWLSAGFETADVDLEKKKVSFIPTQYRSGFGESGQVPFSSSGQSRSKPGHKKGDRHPLFGIWAGQVTLLPDYDYTQPLEPDWGKLDDED